MAFWRIMRGNYDDKYPEVFERRIVALTKLEQERIDQNRRA
jgi:hypothetical protein